MLAVVVDAVARLARLEATMKSRQADRSKRRLERKKPALYVAVAARGALIGVVAEKKERRHRWTL